MGSNPSTIYWMDILSHIFVVKICIVCLKRPKINKKEGRVGPFFVKKTSFPVISGTFKHESNFTANNCKILTTQFPVLGFEIRTITKKGSSLDQKTNQTYLQCYTVSANSTIRIHSLERLTLPFRQFAHAVCVLQARIGGNISLF